MSCDWDVYCVDCESRLGIQDANHRLDLMQLLIAKAERIRRVALAVDSVGSPDNLEFSMRGYSGECWGGSLAWFAEHGSHHLRAINEYNALSGQCTETVTCVCGRTDPCVLDAGHEGPHLPEVNARGCGAARPK